MARSRARRTGRSCAIRSGGRLIDGRVAVVVHAVASLGLRFPPANQNPKSARTALQCGAAGVRAGPIAHPLVRYPVAVVVTPVAALLGTWVSQWIVGRALVVAVAVAVTITHDAGAGLAELDGPAVGVM